MTDLQTSFSPSRRNGLIFHIGVILILGSVGSFCLVSFLQAEETLVILLWMLLTLIFLAPLPLLIYRSYCLLRGFYSLERDGLRIHWGLRAEHIPFSNIEWVRPANEMGFHLPLPFPRWPGSIQGIRKVEDLGEVEFIASERENLLLLATTDRVIAISPADVKAFQRTFQRMVELGSLSPLTSMSSRPTAFWNEIWRDRTAKVFFIVGLALNVILLISMAMMISSHSSLPLGFENTGQPRTAGPPERLLLLPCLSGLAYVFNFLVGVYLFRRENLKIMAYFIWASSLIPPTLFLILLIFLL